MKIIVIVLLLAIGAVVYFSTGKTNVPEPNDGPVVITSGAIWETDLPEGVRLVEDGDPEYSVEVVRVGTSQKPKLEFHITEKKGYIADGIMVTFWYRYKDDDGNWVDDRKKIGYQCSDRLESGGELVESMLPLPHEWMHIENIDLGNSTDENWRAEVAGEIRLMEQETS